jgi:hypothetical protein
MHHLDILIRQGEIMLDGLRPRHEEACRGCFTLHCHAGWILDLS